MIITYQKKQYFSYASQAMPRVEIFKERQNLNTLELEQFGKKLYAQKSVFFEF